MTHVPAQYKKIINRLRKKRAATNKHKNGVVKYLDHPDLERLLHNSKHGPKHDKRNIEKRMGWVE